MALRDVTHTLFCNHVSSHVMRGIADGLIRAFYCRLYLMFDYGATQNSNNMNIYLITTFKIYNYHNRFLITFNFLNHLNNTLTQMRAQYEKIFYCLLVFMPLLSSAQISTPEQALAKYAKYPQERIFLQFDKGDYLAGETMHFKAYVFCNYKLSRISTNLYFECLDNNKQVVHKSRSPIYMGISEGSYTISKKLPENVYYIRAYTSWMLNFEDKFQFIQPINIYNPSSDTRLVEKPFKLEATVQPEGGVLLDRVSTKVAVRMHSTRINKKLSGYLFENTDTTKKLAEVNFLNGEVGSFSIEPAFGKRYSVKINDDQRNTITMALPDVVKQGATIKTTNANKAIAFQIISKGVAEHLANYKVIAHVQGKVIYNDVIKDNSDAFSGSISVDSLKGIVHITLFDPRGSIAAERLCFANAELQPTAAPAISFSKMSAAVRQLNEWQIEVDSIKPYTYAAAIVSDGTPVMDDTRNLLNSFYLADFANHRFNATYFDGDATSTNALDVLMMSKTWDGFDWNKLLTQPLSPFKYFPDNYLTYEGRAEQKRRPVQKKDINLVFHTSDPPRTFVPARTDSLGNFKVRNLFFWDTVKVFYKLNGLSKSDIDIDIKLKAINDEAPYTGSTPLPLYTVTERRRDDSVSQRVKAYAATLNTFETIEKGFNRLQDVTVKATLRSAKDNLNKKLSTPLFRDPGETVFDFINEDLGIGGYGTIIDFLEGKVAGLYIEGNTAVIRGQPARFYLDENPADDIQINTISIADIAMVKVIKNAFKLGGNSSVIAVYTKRGDLQKAASNIPIFNSSVVAGYPLIKKFQTLEYKEESFNQVDSDTRNVLYWNTSFNPVDGKDVIRFYNNDSTKKVRLIVVGFSQHGFPVYFNKMITLK